MSTGLTDAAAIPEGLSVQFGCGLCAPETWLNFDISPTLLLSRIPGAGALLKLPSWGKNVRHGNVVRGLPVPPGSCARVFSDQVLEHLSLGSLRQALRSILAIMKPGGVFRSFVPDLQHSIEVYREAIAANKQREAAGIFVRSIGMGVESSASAMDFIRELFGNSRHLWIWDEAGIRHELETAGFSHFRRARYLDSGDGLFDAVEGCSEWRHEQKALGFQVKCPG